MCANCGFPYAPGHWSEAGSKTSSDRLQARHRRVGVVRALLRPLGLTAHDDFATPGITVATLTGNQQIAEDLSEVWKSAEKLSGRAIDPLAREFTRPHRDRAETANG